MSRSTDEQRKPLQPVRLFSLRIPPYSTSRNLPENQVVLRRDRTWKKDAQTGKFVGHPVGVAALGLNDDDEAGPVSQMSDEEGDASPAPKKKKPAKKSNGRATKGKGKKKTAASDDDEDEEMDDDDGESDDEEGAGT